MFFLILAVLCYGFCDIIILLKILIFQIFIYLNYIYIGVLGFWGAAVGTHPVAPQPAGRRQFQHTRQPAVIGQQQEPLGVDVEPADADQPRQTLGERRENGRATMRVGMRRQEPARLVIEEEPRALAVRQRLAVDDDAVERRDVERGRCDLLAIDGDAAGRDPGLGLAPRAQPGARHHLGDAIAGFGRFGFRGLARHGMSSSWPGSCPAVSGFRIVGCIETWRPGTSHMLGAA